MWWNVSWGEVFICIAATSYVIGKKELPIVAKTMGGYMGRSVGFILRSKKEFFNATKDNDLVEVIGKCIINERVLL